MASSNRDETQLEQAVTKQIAASSLSPTNMESGGPTASVRDSTYDRRKAQTGDSTSARDSQKLMYKGASGSSAA